MIKENLHKLFARKERKILLFGFVFAVIAILIFVRVMAPVSAAISVDNYSFGSATSGSTLSVSHTTSAGANRLMLVGVSLNNNTVSNDVQSITYNGLPLSLVGTANQNTHSRVTVYYMTAPPSGTFNVNVTLNSTLCAGCGFNVGVATFTGVDQTTPLGTFAIGNGNSVSSSATVVSTSGELIFDTVGCEACTSLTPGSGQSQLWNLTSGTGATLELGGASTENGASSVIMSWTLGVGKPWAMLAVPIKPAAAPTITPSNSPVPPTPSKTPTPSISPLPPSLTPTKTPTPTATFTPTKTPTPPVLSLTPSTILSPTAVITGANLDSVSSIYSYSGLGYYTLDPAFDGNRTANKDVNIFLISGSLEISQNFDLTDSKDSVTFIVNGNILIDGNVTRIPGVYISSQTFSVAQSNNPLIIDGMVYANNFNLNRSYYSLTAPTYQIIYQPKYAIDLLPYLGRSQINWQEIK